MANSIHLTNKFLVFPILSFPSNRVKKNSLLNLFRIELHALRIDVSLID
jgi:hypothetical protein